MTLRHGKGKGSPTAAYPQVTEPGLTLRPCRHGVSSRSGRADAGSADAQTVWTRGQLTLKPCAAGSAHAQTVWTRGQLMLRPCGHGVGGRSDREDGGSADARTVWTRDQLTLKPCGRRVSSHSGRGDMEPAHSQRVPGLVHSVSFRVTSQLSLLCMYHC